MKASSSSSLRRKSKSVDSGSKTTTVAELENQIFESRENYNNIVKLLLLSKKDAFQLAEGASPATMSLCRVFIRLIGLGALEKSKDTSDAELAVIKWLKDRFSEYLDLIFQAFHNTPSTAYVAILMAIAKSQFQQSPVTAWRNGAFNRLFEVLLLQDRLDFHDARVFFVSQYLEKYRDLTYYFFKLIRLVYKNEKQTHVLPTNGIAILLNWKPFDNAFESRECFGEYPKSAKQFSSASCLEAAQEIWLLFLGSGLTTSQRKVVLKSFTTSVSPWFQKPELLLDFLTDSYNTGGSTSLLALSGVFFLIVEKNLEYPQFYLKLYSLLDESILHSKHRSQFFRLLNTFMASTHLPSAMIASFIKRLSRLALFAPPAAIVIVIPWVYNLLKAHPSTTFMIHRVVQDPTERNRIESEGLDDPFDPAEPDPLKTRAIDSCLWELVTLQSHYHPNVATVAKIISQQFLKESYNLEDFLDYSYASIIQTDLGKKMRQTPAFEYEIPKQILMESETQLNDLGAAFLAASECF